MTRRGTPLEELYFSWLVAPLDRKWNETFDDGLLRHLHSTKFEHFVPNDQNRAADGAALRERFLYEHPVKSSVWEVNGFLDEECSVLEMLIALAEHCSYQAGDKMCDWFSTYIRNLGLSGKYNPSRTRRALQRLNKRTYSHDGTGGLFPLAHPLEDQRQVELWYQMAAYIIESYDGVEV